MDCSLHVVLMPVLPPPHAVPQATLVEAARYCGAEAAARVERLTVRKLYQREYHFFDGDTGELGWAGWAGQAYVVGLPRGQAGG
jgi:hypothetical protein